MAGLRARSNAAVIDSARLALSVCAAALLGIVVAACDPSNVQPGDGKACDDVNQPCAAPDVCQDGACVAPCTAGSGCLQGLCDEESGRCVDCLTSDDCDPGKVCNAFSHDCVDPVQGCSTDGDCSGGQHCDTIKGGCVECLSDGDCAGGALCNQATSTCTTTQSCATDDDCIDGVCDPGRGVCVECLGPANCASGVCDTTTNTCVAGCTDDDASEPNDGLDALPIASGGAHEGAICPGDIDEFLVDAAGTVVATLTVQGAGPLTLVLEGPGGGVIATATPVNDDTLSLTAPDLAQAQYRLIVRGDGADANADYLLSVDVSAPSTCTQLDAEPNDTTGAAVSIAADDALHSGAICGTDVDLFRFTAAAGDNVEAAVVPGDGAGTLALSLLDANGNVLATAPAAGQPATLAGVTAGAYFARVSATGGDITYSVRVNATASPPVCNQTDAEPNDTDAQALSLQPGTPASGTICPGDVDQFRFAAAALDDAAITVTGSNVTARLVRASDGAQIATGTTMSAPDLVAGGYRVVVQGSSASTQTSYTVRVTLTPEPVPDPCDEGGIEPDSLAAPRTLGLDGTPLAGRVCADDTDFFTFTLPFQSTVTVHARFTHANGDLDMRLVDAAGGTVTSSVSVTDDEIIVRQLDAGTYTAEIFGFSGALNTYTMEATLQGCSPDDGFEDNNAVSRATPIGGNALSAVRCPGDDDFYLLKLQSGDSLDAVLAGDGLTFSLVSATDGSVARNDTASGGNRRIQASGLPAGRYALRVTGGSADRIAYTLTPSITPGDGRCVDDGADPNERAVDAFALDATGLQDGSYEVGALMSCAQFDQDWFSVALPADKLVTVQLAFDPADDVDVGVLEPKGTSGLTRTLARSFATNKQDRVSGMINQAGTYLIMAEGFRSTPEPYGIGITLDDPPASSCVNDRFDTWSATTSTTTDETFRNDDVTTEATELSTTSPESFANMRICPGDHDFFVLKSVAAGKHVVVHVDYVHSSDKDIDIRLYGPGSSTQVASSLGTDGTEDIDFAVTTAGDYFVEVHEFLDDGDNFYDMTTNVQ